MALTPTRPVAAGPLILLIPVIVLSVQAAAWMATTSATTDESTYLRLSRDAYGQGEFSDLGLHGVAPLPVLAAYGPVAVARPAAFRDAITLARASAVVLFALPVLLLTYAWLARHAGRTAGFAGAMLLALSPNFVGHASLAATDVAFVAAALVTLAALAWHLEAPSSRRLAWLALALCVATATKYSSLGLFLVVAITLFVDEAQRAADVRGLVRAAARVVVTVGAMLGVALIFTWAVLGFDFTTGTPPAVDVHLRLPAALWGFLYQIDHAVIDGHQGFLMGERQQHGWWYYMPVALAMKSTPIELCLYAAAMYVFVRTRRMESTALRVWRTTFVIFLVLSMSSGVNVGVRYVLILLPLAVMAALVLLFDNRRPRTVMAVAAAAIVVQASSAIAVAPHYLSYFNAFAGGPSQGYRLLVDSNLDWGQDLPALADALEDIGAERPVVTYFGSARFEDYGLTAARWPVSDEVLASADWIAISATCLAGVYECGTWMAAFRDLAPSARAAHTMFLYDLDRPEVRRAANEAAEETRQAIARRPR